MISISWHENRQSHYEILPHILERWSPRSFTGDPIPREDLLAMFEAARFAPSSYNEQPWRFVFALRGTPHFDKFKDVLSEGNWRWVQKASALMLIAAKKTLSRTGDVNRCCEFDAGCAWGYLALEATRRGYVTHAMAGFRMDKAISVLGIPGDYTPIAAVAVAKLAEKDFLPESLAEREYPKPRMNQMKFAFEGGFPAESGGVENNDFTDD